MNYPTVFFICVIIVALMVWAINYFHAIRIKSSSSQEKKRLDNLEIVCSIGLLATLFFALFSPIIYEFKPLAGDTQYKMIRDNTGKIVALEKGATGFHKPFCSADTFVCLPDKMDSFGNGVVYTIGGFDSEVVVIQCTTLCEDYPKAFIETNGAFIQCGNLHVFGGTRLGFMKWVHEEFNKILRKDMLAEKEKGKAVVLDTPADVYNFVRETADKWNNSNPYSCKIMLKQP
jgi:hypothetical protein